MTKPFATFCKYSRNGKHNNLNEQKVVSVIFYLQWITEFTITKIFTECKSSHTIPFLYLSFGVLLLLLSNSLSVRTNSQEKKFAQKMRCSVMFAYGDTAFSLRGLVSGNITSIFNKLCATKTGQYYPCASLPSRAIQNVSRTFNRRIEKSSTVSDMTTTPYCCGPAYELTDLRKLMYYNSIPISLQFQTFDQKTRHFQHCHTTSLNLSPSHQTHHILLLADNKRQTCPGTKDVE